MAKIKTLQDGDKVRTSLLNLRDEMMKIGAWDIPTDEVIMKINSCLFSQYPPEYTKS